MYTSDYQRAMKILDSQERRDWELESACRNVRQATSVADGYNVHLALANVRDILQRRYDG